MRAVRRLSLAAGVLAALAACGTAPPATGRQLVVIAVDGLDPDVAERLLRARRLPNLAALAESSGLVRVTSTPGAEPASAWASLATGVTAGTHGIFDLVAPDPVSGRPRAATLVPRPSARWLGSWWSEGPAYAPVRQGVPFWSRLGETGVRSRILFVPGTFPPEPVPAGALVAGAPLPDLGGRLGAYTWLATDVPPERTGFARFGGRVVRLGFEHWVAHATITGIRAPVAKDLPITVVWNPEARSANITIGDTFVHLDEGQSSRWLDVTLALNPITSVNGLVQIHLARAGNDVSIYVSPVQWHPHRPPSPIGAPAAFAEALFDRLGVYRTLAWPGAGWALADGWLDEARFGASLDEGFADRAAVLQNIAESRDWDVIVAGIETIDAAQHLLWRLLDPGHAMYDPELAREHGRRVETLYVRLDELVGQVRASLGPDAALVVMSPYGVYTARHVVDLNRWLSSEGLLVWAGEPDPVTLAGLTDDRAWSDTVDWTATRARAMGAGQIFINLQDRDPNGIVAPGGEYDALLARIRAGLEVLTDPVSGRRVVSRVREGREIYTGPLADRAPDLLVTFSPGYSVSWDTRMGGAGAAVVARNTERWSAEHASADERTVPGVWLSSFPVDAEDMSILDLAPTVLDYFERPVPPELDGRSRLIEAAPSNVSGPAPD